MTEHVHRQHLESAELPVREAKDVAIGDGENKHGTPTISLLLRAWGDEVWLEYEMTLDEVERHQEVLAKHVASLREKLEN